MDIVDKTDRSILKLLQEKHFILIGVGTTDIALTKTDIFNN